ncbi:MAG: FAD-dependent oxidoreductase [Verrucomicrobia bacterium]|nr:FAD-dependent oxidoreductase [Verrucomicrobiota bacterium]
MNQTKETARSSPAHPRQVAAGNAVVLEAPRRTPVVADVDVLVVGGGPAGVAATLAAAQSGARTLCLERHGMLGGVWTAGLLNPLFDAFGKGWIVQALIDRLIAAQAWRKWNWTHTFDTEAMKLVLEEMFTEARAEWWYYTTCVDAIVEAGRIRGVVVESKSGREAVLAKVVIDCSGDGDLVARAGAGFDLGRQSDGLCQPMTLMFEVDGLGAFPEQQSSEVLYDHLQEAMARVGKVELPFGRAKNVPWIIHLPQAGSGAVQATHVYRVNALDSRALTQATVEARRQAHELVKVLRATPHLQDLRIRQTAAAIGVREARRIRGRYCLGSEDITAGRRFADGVTFGTFPVDVHEVNPDDKVRSSRISSTQPYEIPYRCLLPLGLEGVLVAGRCISGTHEAHASYRVTGTCMGMGQAAGLAAAMAAAENVGPDRIPGAVLKAELARRGVGLLDGKAPEAIVGDLYGEKLVWH